MQASCSPRKVDVQSTHGRLLGAKLRASWCAGVRVHEICVAALPKATTMNAPEHESRLLSHREPTVSLASSTVSCSVVGSLHEPSCKTYWPALPSDNTAHRVLSHVLVETHQSQSATVVVRATSELTLPGSKRKSSPPNQLSHRAGQELNTNTQAASNGAFIAVVCARPARSYTPALDTQCHVLVLGRGHTSVR